MDPLIPLRCFGGVGSKANDLTEGLILWGCRSKANDLREQLIFWGTPPEATWPAREQRLDWLEFALMEARDIAMGLRQHGALTPAAQGLHTYVDIVKVPLVTRLSLPRFVADFSEKFFPSFWSFSFSLFGSTRKALEEPLRGNRTRKPRYPCQGHRVYLFPPPFSWIILK
jgi:hypothetical protein